MQAIDRPRLAALSVLACVLLAVVRPSALAAAPDPLNNDSPSNFTIGKDSKRYFAITLPPKAYELAFELYGGTGDADLYVRRGAQPTQTVYDCRPFVNGNDETCEIPRPEPDVYHVMIYGYAIYSQTTVVARYCTRPNDIESNDVRSSPQWPSGPCYEIKGTFVGESNPNDYTGVSVRPGETLVARLDELSVDYDLYAYSWLGGAEAPIATSTNISTTPDQIWWTNESNETRTVSIRVYRYSSVGAPYRLTVSQ